MGSVIQTEKLSKRYGRLKAVENVSINIQQGEIYGFLGLNGAGKTTTIRMILGLIRPSSGFTLLKGGKVSAGHSEMWKDIGYMVEVPYAYPDLTVRENLEIIRKLRLINDPGSVNSIIARLKLDAYSDVAARNLSLGNAQRLGLAKALIHEPAILILDEPANGLDPVGIVEIRELLTDLAVNKGVTILVSSHILGEISKFATRIGIINNGLLIHESSLADMEILRKCSLHVKTRDMAGAGMLLREKGFEVFASEEGYFELFQPEIISNPDRIAVLLTNSGLPPTMLKVEEEDLESFFLRIINTKSSS